MAEEKKKKMADDVRAQMVNMIAAGYAERLARIKGRGTEAGLKGFADGFMHAVRCMSNVGWSGSTRGAVHAALRALCLTNGWALAPTADPVPPEPEGGKQQAGDTGVPPGNN
jgi:hypothetical protein